MNFDSTFGAGLATADGSIILTVSPLTSSTTMALSITNDGPGAVTDVVISKQNVNLFACPWLPVLGSGDYQPSSTGLISNNVLESTIGFPAIAAGASGMVVFTHNRPYLVQVTVVSDEQGANVRVFCQR